MTEGTIFHYNGVSWSESRSDNEATFTDIWGSSSIYVLENGNESITFWRHDGTSWQGLSIPTCFDECELLRIWGSAEDDIFVLANERDRGDRLLLLHYDGTDWTVTPDAMPFVRMGGVWEHVVAVSEQGTMWHLNARASRSFEMPSLISSSILAGWGNSSSNVFAVGEDGIIFHFDGKAWLQMPSPTVATLNAIWGSGPNDIFAVGTSGTILHYDGERWSEMASPTFETLHAIWGDGPQRALAVGDNGTVLLFDGLEWSTMEYTHDLYDLENVWIRGQTIFATSRWGLFKHDGTSWSDLRSFYDFYDGFVAVWGTKPDNVFIANNQDDWTGDDWHYGKEGLIWHYNGEELTEVYIQDTFFNDMYGTDQHNIIAVGDEGIVRYDGVDWTPVAAGIAQPLHTVWSTPTVTFMVTEGKEIYRMTNAFN